MKNDWIAFYRNGEVCMDVVLQYGKDGTYPHYDYAITPRYGKVDCASIIETRADRERREEGNGNG